jgi:hypothetical protein
MALKLDTCLGDGTMIAMIQRTAKLAFAAIVLATLALQVTPAAAGDFAYVAAYGNDTWACTFDQPCATFSAAFNSITYNGQINCVGAIGVIDSINMSSAPPPGGFVLLAKNFSVDCPGSVWLSNGFQQLLTWFKATNSVKFRHLTFNNGFNPTVAFIAINGGGDLIIEDCVFENAGGAVAIDIEPHGQLNLVIKNTRISNNGSGILIKPFAGGSVNVTLDHVTINKNSGGGIKIDTSGGPVTTDITDSVVSGNGGNGINAIGGANQNIVSIKNSVIAKNGVAGVQVAGGNAGVLIATSLLDQNASGATSVVNGGNMFTYGNNQIVGPIGAGFTATATLH